MKLHELTKVKIGSNKRIGRGIGSGKGKTGGRGTKGQKARGKIPVYFSGSTLPMYKKLPLRRGQGNARFSTKLKILNVSSLKTFKPKATIDLQTLIEKGVISQKDARGGIKILGGGEVSRGLVVKLPTSIAAKQKIEAAGGKVSV